MKLRLYHYWRSTSSWRVRFAFAYKGIPCEFVTVDLLKGESRSETHLERNPMGRVPVLEFMGEPPPLGGRFLGESIAILEWAEETYPFPPLLPQDSFARARVRELTEIVNSGIQPFGNPRTQKKVSDDPEKQKAWVQYWIQAGLSAYDAIAQKTARKFSVGDELTLADICLIPQLYGARRYEVSLDSFPALLRIWENAKALSAYEASEPARYEPGS